MAEQFWFLLRCQCLHSQQTWTENRPPGSLAAVLVEWIQHTPSFPVQLGA